MIQARRSTGTKKPKAPGSTLPRVVSLFSGAGGLDLGFKEVGFGVGVALDFDAAAVRTHKRNFPATESQVADLVKLGPQGVLQIVKRVIPSGSAIGVIGGPPCQGFSRANTKRSTDDPRNKLPGIYLGIVKALQAEFMVEFVVFENVLGIRDAKHAKTYSNILSRLRKLGFHVQARELNALDFGVPQTRKRVIVTGVRKGKVAPLAAPRPYRGKATVREAIGGLKRPAFHSYDLKPSDIPVHPNHWTMRPKSPRFARPRSPQGSGRSFKRLEWGKPSPTIAFGHREIHVHPSGRRRLSLFEAMRLQGFPDGFVLEGNLSEQVTQVSNAVPPPLARSIARTLRRSLEVA